VLADKIRSPLDPPYNPFHTITSPTQAPCFDYTTPPNCSFSVYKHHTTESSFWRELYHYERQRTGRETL